MIKAGEPDMEMLDLLQFLRTNNYFSCTYCIVLGKRPWALAARPPKIEGGRLHGGGA